MPITDINRFWSKVAKGESCWLWTACKTNNGYGRACVGARVELAHRVSYELAKGPIPGGLQIDHTCRVRHCVNPDHLDAVTPAENAQRARPFNYNRAKTHCPKGHPYSEANTAIYPNGRYCIQCNRDKARAVRERRAKRGSF